MMQSGCYLSLELELTIHPEPPPQAEHHPKPLPPPPLQQPRPPRLNLMAPLSGNALCQAHFRMRSVLDCGMHATDNVRTGQTRFKTLSPG